MKLSGSKNSTLHLLGDRQKNENKSNQDVFFSPLKRSEHALAGLPVGRTSLQPLSHQLLLKTLQGLDFWPRCSVEESTGPVESNVQSTSSPTIYSFSASLTALHSHIVSTSLPLAWGEEACPCQIHQNEGAS